MCHLAIEKALKGLYFERRNEFPPKSHSLIFRLNEIGVNPPENLGHHGDVVWRLSLQWVFDANPADDLSVVKIFG